MGEIITKMFMRGFDEGEVKGEVLARGRGERVTKLAKRVKVQGGVIVSRRRRSKGRIIVQHQVGSRV